MKFANCRIYSQEERCTKSVRVQKFQTFPGRYLKIICFYDDRQQANLIISKKAQLATVLFKRQIERGN